MPSLSKTIEGSGYHPEGDSLGFHFEDLSVLMEPHRMTIIGAETEARARTVIEWLEGKL
jgi:hypothetical protein